MPISTNMESSRGSPIRDGVQNLHALFHRDEWRDRHAGAGDYLKHRALFQMPVPRGQRRAGTIRTWRALPAGCARELELPEP
jgi:hypothetical protein